MWNVNCRVVKKWSMTIFSFGLAVRREKSGFTLMHVTFTYRRRGLIFHHQIIQLKYADEWGMQILFRAQNFDCRIAFFVGKTENLFDFFVSCNGEFDSLWKFTMLTLEIQNSSKWEKFLSSEIHSQTLRNHSFLCVSCRVTPFFTIHNDRLDELGKNVFIFHSYFESITNNSRKFPIVVNSWVVRLSSNSHFVLDVLFIQLWKTWHSNKYKYLHSKLSVISR